jgi:hypothetical protein
MWPDVTELILEGCENPRKYFINNSRYGSLDDDDDDDYYYYILSA